MLQDVLDVSQRFACKVVGQPRSTQRTPPAAHTPADPDVELRAWLRTWAGANPRKGHRRAWAALRAEGMVVNRKKVQRLWREEGHRHSRLGYLTPDEYAAQCKCTHRPSK